MSIDKNVKKGDPFRVTAETWNAMLDAARDKIARDLAQAGTVRRIAPFGDILQLINHTGSVIRPGDPVAIGPRIGLRSMADNAPVLLAESPMPGIAQPIAVALDGAAPDAVLRARLDGPALIRLSNQPQPGFSADIGPDHRFTASAEGIWPILGWTELDDGHGNIMVAALIVLQPGSAAGRKGMFSIVPSYSDIGVIDGYRVVDTYSPDNGLAGVAHVNNQPFEVESIVVPPPNRTTYIYFLFTAPLDADDLTDQPSPATAEIIASDTLRQSTPLVVYHLIGRLLVTEYLAEQQLDHGEAELQTRLVVTVAQDHAPGNLYVDWYGPCFHLLQDPSALYLPPQPESPKETP